MKNKKILIVSLILVLLLLIGLFLVYRNWDKWFGTVPVSPGGTSQSPAGFPLSYGSRGEEVRKFQMYLLSRDPGCLPQFGADGIWGSETELCSQRLLGKNVIAYNDYRSYGLA